jgi:hypothetical protein
VRLSGWWLAGCFCIDGTGLAGLGCSMGVGHLDSWMVVVVVNVGGM